MQGFNSKNWSSHSQIVKIIGENKKVLEFGCGKGFVSEQLQKKGNKVTGIEINAENAKQAEKFCEQIIAGDIETIDFSKLGKNFDAVIFGDVLEHLKNPGAVLKKTRELIHNNGFVVASIPNIANWKIRLHLLGGKFDYAEQGILDKTHLKFFTLKNAEKLFLDSGFEIRKIDSVPSAPVPTNALKKLFSRAMPGLFSFQFIIVAGLKK